MKKTIKETREMINKITEFLSEDGIKGAAEQAAEEFLIKHAQDLESKFGQRWQTKGGEWALNSNNVDWLHDLVWQFVTDEFPEHMGDEERSEKFVQSVMSYIE